MFNPNAIGVGAHADGVAVKHLTFGRARYTASPDGLTLHLNATDFTFSAGSVSAVHVRTHSGNDVINVTSMLGAALLDAGDGDDTLVTAAMTFQRIAGGSGFDTLQLSGGGLVPDLPAIANDRLANLEVFDIRGSGTNTLNVNLNEVLNLADESGTLRGLRDGLEAHPTAFRIASD